MNFVNKADHMSLDRGQSSPLLDTYRPRVSPQAGLSQNERQQLIDAFRTSLAEGGAAGKTR